MPRDGRKLSAEAERACDLLEVQILELIREGLGVLGESLSETDVN